MKMNRREFVERASAMLIAFVVGIKTTKQPHVSNQALDDFAFLMASQEAWKLDLGLVSNGPETITVPLGRSANLMPTWGISAAEVQARIEELKNSEST